MNSRISHTAWSLAFALAAVTQTVGCMPTDGTGSELESDTVPGEGAGARSSVSPEEILEVGRNVNVEEARLSMSQVPLTRFDSGPIDKVRNGTLGDYQFAAGNGIVLLVGVGGAACTGQVLNNRFIVTAAHCFEGPTPLLPGFSNRLQVYLTDTGNEVYSGWASAYQQPGWRRGDKDLALIFLSQPMTTCQFGLSHCRTYLPNKPVNAWFQYFPEGPAPRVFGSYEFAGYGSTDGSASSDGRMRIGMLATCCPPYWGPGHSSDRQGFGFMMSWDNDNARPCKVDSGGPLIVPINVGRPVYTGIVSKGVMTDSCLPVKGTVDYTGISVWQANWIWGLVNNIKGFLAINFDCGIGYHDGVWMIGCDNDGSIF